MVTIICNPVEASLILPGDVIQVSLHNSAVRLMVSNVSIEGDIVIIRFHDNRSEPDAWLKYNINDTIDVVRRGV